jgi:hypothetical protein
MVVDNTKQIAHLIGIVIQSYDNNLVLGAIKVTVSALCAEFFD